jgi:hypothetical protein
MSEEDIQILIDQTSISRELAKKLIIYKGGDIVESILELENNSNLEELEKKLLQINKHIDDDEEKEVDTSKRENLVSYRDIVDEKDNIYNYKSEQKKKRKEKARLIQEKRDKGESTEELEEKKLCNESLYYSFRNNNINNIKVL